MPYKMTSTGLSHVFQRPRPKKAKGLTYIIGVNYTVEP